MECNWTAQLEWNSFRNKKAIFCIDDDELSIIHYYWPDNNINCTYTHVHLESICDTVFWTHPVRRQPLIQMNVAGETPFEFRMKPHEMLLTGVHSKHFGMTRACCLLLPPASFTASEIINNVERRSALPLQAQDQRSSVLDPQSSIRHSACGAKHWKWTKAARFI